MSADRRSRTLPPIRDISARVQTRLSGRLVSLKSEMSSFSSSSAVGASSSPWAACCNANRGSHADEEGKPAPAPRRGVPERRSRGECGPCFPRVPHNGPARRHCRPRCWARPGQTAQLHRLAARTQHAEGVDRAVPKHPRVFAVAAALHRDHRSFGLGHADKSAGKGNPSITRVKHVSAQHHAARLRHPFSQTGAVESVTCSCATYSCGRARSCLANFPFSAWGAQSQRPAPCPAKEMPASPRPNRDDSAPNRARTCPHHQVATEGSFSFSPSR